MNPKIYLCYAVLFGSIGLIASDTFIPAMSLIAKHFQVSVSLIQGTIALFMLGFSLARFTVSLLSDGLGRKGLFIFCFGLLTLGSALCLFAPNAHLFLIGRLLQGLGAGGSNVLARVIIRDIADNRSLAKYNSLYSMFAVTFMVAAPFLGSVLVTYLNWRSVFLVLTVLSLLALGLASFILKETNLHRDVMHLKPAQMKSNFLELIKRSGSFQYACFLFASFGLMTAWLTAGSVVLQDTLHLSYLEFGYCALWVGFFYFLASLISSRYVSQVGEKKLIQLGSRLLIVPPLILVLGFAAPLPLQVILIVASVAIAFFATGFIIPNAYSLGMKSFANIAGMAGACFGFAQMFGGSVYSFVISCGDTHSILPLWLSMLATVLLVWAVRLMGTRTRVL